MTHSKQPWSSRLLCLIGVHSWSDGPGHPCVECGQVDTLHLADEAVRAVKRKDMIKSMFKAMQEDEDEVEHAPPIRHAAIMRDGIVYVGKRHHNCIRTMVDCGLTTPVGGTQGFVDGNGKFWDRYQSLRIAERHSQILRKHSPLGMLLSEDLY